jgi:filamentous hemagglutinin
MPWLRHFALFLVFVAALFRPAAAGAFVSPPDANAQARVGAFEVVAGTLVGPTSAATCGLHEGIGAAYNENASGYRFAAGGGAWRVGGDIYAPTARGTAPSWSTVRSRFWRNEAAAEGAAERYGAENLERMSRGRAPQRFNPDKGGMESMELSHEPVPAREGGRDFVPRWPQDHAAVDPHRRPGY